jgi:hypothetical protein
MVAYTHEEALRFHGIFWQKWAAEYVDQSTYDNMCPTDIIWRVVSQYCFITPVHAWEPKYREITEKVLFSDSIEEMPLYINSKTPIKEFAQWRLSCGK